MAWRADSNEKKRAPAPIDAARLQQLALRYVERYATTRAKLAAYLRRKIAERGWEGDAPADPVGLAERFAELGYVDDRAFAGARASALTRRGYGGRRIGAALDAAGVARSDRGEAEATIDENARSAAFALARRRRIGPFGPETSDRQTREKAIAVLVRAGHDFALAREIASMSAADLLASEQEGETP